MSELRLSFGRSADEFRQQHTCYECPIIKANVGETSYSFIDANSNGKVDGLDNLSLPMEVLVRTKSDEHFFSDKDLINELRHAAHDNKSEVVIIENPSEIGLAKGFKGGVFPITGPKFLEYKSMDDYIYDLSNQGLTSQMKNSGHHTGYLGVAISFALDNDNPQLMLFRDKE
jgi:hypothetical protein